MLSQFLLLYSHAATILVSSILFFALLELAIKCLSSKGLFRFLIRPSILDDTILSKNPIIPPCYSTEKWFTEYICEAKQIFFNQKWSPFVYWEMKQFRGKHINIIKDGVRKTTNLNNNKSKINSKIFFQGGSVAWGWGARDHATPASYISGMLSKSGLHFDCENISQLGYISSQQLLQLIKLIQRGYVPDLVICLDGLNDAFTAYQSNSLGDAQNEMNRKLEFNQTLYSHFSRVLSNSYIANVISQIIRTLFGKKEHLQKSVSDSLLKQKIRRSASLYVTNMLIYRSLARDYNFEVRFFFQPSVFSKKKLSSFESKLMQKQKFWYEYYSLFYELVMKDNRLPKEFKDLAGVFDEIEDTIFIDPWHCSENGNKLIAEEIFSSLYKFPEKK